MQQRIADIEVARRTAPSDQLSVLGREVRELTGELAAMKASVMATEFTGP